MPLNLMVLVDSNLMYDTDKLIERVILVAIEKDNELITIDASLNELAELARTSGAVEAGRLIQKRENVHPAYYLGKGKLQELKDLVTLTKATGIICDDELSNSQMKNMEEVLDTKIIDRTMLILDIFARHAVTAEGKLQVELAQLKYNISHLSGIGKAMSRLGGGIGTRGPGETKLETDRRHIRKRIGELNRYLGEIGGHRSILREKREKSNIPVVSMIGYTNAGKSTLMNAISDAGVLAEDKLFATLDTTTRKITLPGGTDILFSDTVGFIQKLPHHLIQAFRATLDELRYADILVHVVDGSSAISAEQMSVVYQQLTELKCMEKPIITVYNKCDRPEFSPPPTDKLAEKTIHISAMEGTGVEKVAAAIEDLLKSFRTRLKVLIPYTEGQLINIIHGGAEILTEEHREAGTYMELYTDEELTGRLKKYILA